MAKPVKTERRSRRTHKNSKDGCPNCRSNRIKCSEELPVCVNCIKKGLRCGYLDFSHEKLEHIRRKHACIAAGGVAYDLGVPNPKTSPFPMLPDYSAPMTPYVSEIYPQSAPDGTFESDSAFDPLGPEYLEPYSKPSDLPSVGHYTPMTPYNHVSKNQVLKPSHRREKPASHLIRSTRVSSDIRSKVYSRVFSHVASGLTETDQHSKNPMEQLLETTSLGDWNSGDTLTYPELLVTQSTADASGDGPNGTQISTLHVPDLRFEIAQKRLFQKHASNMGKLPNCIELKKTFVRLEVPSDLKINFTPNHFLRKRNSSLSHIDSEEPVVRPIYFERDSRQYWLGVFSRATRFDLFFLYFIDKSLNILMRASEAVVSGDIITTPPGDNASENSEGNFFSFFYNSHDLETLTQKSYVTYGKVISELRKSISCFNPEHPAKMSLFSARACYMNPSTDFKTFSLMMSGTLILFKNILSNVSTQERAEHNIRQEIRMLNYFSNMSVCPDYNYEVIWDLKKSFRAYKSFVDRLAAKSSPSSALDSDVESVLKDSLFMHNCHELDKYFAKLETYYIPMIQQYNEHFNNISQGSGDSAIRFTSPTLIFDMMYEWFKIYPGERSLMGTKLHPLKRIIFLFYHALGKTLNHVLTPIKAVSFVDPCNIMFTKVGMQFSKLDGCELSSCSELMPVIASIYRTIRYFESRSILYAYYMDNDTVLEQDYLRSVATHAPKEWSYRDIVQMCPKKMQSETQVTCFSSGYFRMENYAFLEPLLSHATCAELITQELDRQNYALAKEPYFFNFDLGLSNHDFNPELIIDCYVNSRNEQLRKRGHTPVDRASLRVETLIRAHYEIDAAGKTAAERNTSKEFETG